MKNEKHLHIISFDIPFPADYGGVIDVFYKIKALSEKEIKVHLHCFQYGRKQAAILEQYCEEVRYYNRETGFLSNLSLTPYIIKSRISNELIERLTKDYYPILCEGMHTCGILLDARLDGRKIIYRSSNVEHHYYTGLAEKERNPLKRLYFKLEAAKLKKWEANLARADLFLSVSKSEQQYYQQYFPNNRTENLYSFFEQKDKLKPNFESNKRYVLFHGNLSVHENEKTALYICHKLAPRLDISFIIAGKQPSTNLIEAAKNADNINIIANPNDEHMHQLIGEAHINLMLTDQPTGLKLKLLNSLYQGKFCLVNNEMLVGTGLEKCVEIGNSTSELSDKINELMQKEFTETDFEKRNQIIPEEFGNTFKTIKLIKLIWEELN